MTDTSFDSELAEFLSDLSVAVVIAIQTQEDERIEALSSRLEEIKQAADEADAPELAAYLDVLRGLVRGEDVDTAAEKLVEPYLWGYERILQELEEGPESSDASSSEWVASMTSLVATTVKSGSEEDRAELERELVRIAGRIPAEETKFHDFIAVLGGVLRGEDTRELGVKLQPPYRQAYHSLLQLLAADDTTEFALQAVLDRVQHNTVVALTQGDRELRLSVAEALADVEERLPEDDPTSPDFRILILGAMALLLDREPPQAVSTLSGTFAETWQSMLQASRK